MKQENHILPYFTACCVSLILGLTFIFSKTALNIVTPCTLLSFRFLTAFLTITLLRVLKIVKINYKGKPIKYLIILSLIEPVLYFFFESKGLKLCSASQAGIVIALIPIFVAILSSYILKERKTSLQICSIILSVCGVIYIVLMQSSSSNKGSLLGIFFLFGSVLCGSIFSILSKKLAESFKPIEITYFMSGVAAIIFNFISIVNHIRLHTLTLYFEPLKNNNFIISILYLGILSSVIGFFLVNFTISKIDVSKYSVFENVTSIISILGGVIFLHEKLKYYHGIGAIMIVIGVWGTSFFAKKSLNQSSKLEISQSS
ncbi:DMT family transporter [Clostridium botulinum]|uniref:Permease n=1 Tax=Clostridium botulinum TaxID=1491 RepID=A0A9Q1ZG74_CLOBO|nr:DMT family transporter [Clostridium botulinum]KEI02936.1 permease [Clostridium botulinum D str. 16868]KEI03055.1 permease [Clostridium botulinum C/D str. Sp77]KLU76175.1 permease [Clostridium botulinum V891]KOA79345.1 permease [Clostridium botulinum]KOA85561.1 permease [Clostridium botulinum]